MSEHTKEPWRLGNYPNGDMHSAEAVLVDLPGDRRYVLLTCNINFPEDAKANARRIVACVNALEGVPTEWLESYTAGNVENVLQENARLKQERDELAAQVWVTREALEDCIDDSREVLNELVAKGYGDTFRPHRLEAQRNTVDVAEKALSITPPAALREIQARVLEEAAKLEPRNALEAAALKLG